MSTSTLHFELKIKCYTLDCKGDETHTHTHLLHIALLCGPACIQPSECFSQIIRHAPFCKDWASRNRRIGRFGSTEDLLAEVCVENNRTADALNRKALPATSKVHQV